MVTFEQLLKALPQSTQNDWKAAAEAQLKGKPLDSIAFSSLSGGAVSPYSQRLDGVAPAYFGTGVWSQLTDLRFSENPDEALLMEELTGGAQGFRLNQDQLNGLIHASSEVRWDFLTLELIGADDSGVGLLRDLVPEVQRKELKPYVHADSSSIQAFKTVFPLTVQVVPCSLSGGVVESLTLWSKQVIKAITASAKPSEINIAAELEIPSNYFSAISIVRALKLLYANICNGFELSGKPGNLEVVGSIAPLSTQSHEDYLIDASCRVVAAVSGGVSALCLRPFESSQEGVARRRVRNIQNVLAIEGKLGFANDLVSGSYFFENEANKLAAEVWSRI